MDWNRIKTIFIVTFFILDLFLVFQFISKQDSNQLDLMAETRVDQQLKDDNITVGDLPKEPRKDSFITAKNKEFKEEDIRSLKNQTVTLQGANTIVSKLKEPLLNAKTLSKDKYSEFLKSYVLDGQKYEFGKAEATKIYFFQKYKDKPIFYNDHGMIVVDINEKGEFVSYTQTMLTDLKEMGENEKAKEQEIITAQTALENLFFKNEIKQNTHFKEAQIGYATLVTSSASNMQVLAPTWNLKTDRKVDYFVNAIEGQVIKLGKEKENEKIME
ncbi:two-component system regulatory protein YycI [Bacillus arachidis]|uniref:Two-component system regulatory protein YycI n=1 Tax=Bacillus arachidis TaxID=2819290 RepID=A0ABS3NTD1_9BACI|nr:two-component system regulatory protein YycI [Bacillus arachidis]MBO1624174.1 two-component system regulatory protein YycI [Bacillus arachidis]